VTRVAGANRYETAALLSQLAFPGTAAGAVVASGEAFADALGGAALAAGLGVPLLLSPRDTSLAVTTDELLRVALNQAVYLLGGPAAISDATLDAMSAATTVETAEDIQWVEIVRVAGRDRFETSAVAAAQLGDPLDDSISVPEVVVSTGMNFPDGLVAVALGEPLLLLPPSGIPDSTTEVLGVLRPAAVLIMGGSAAVSDAQASALAAAVG
jgi:putative cell wall-binding protein